MGDVTNTDIYEALMDIREDLGGLKTGQSLQLEGLKNHAGRIAELEGASQRQKGAVTAWGLVATGIATIAGVAAQMFTGKH